MFKILLLTSLINGWQGMTILSCQINPASFPLCEYEDSDNCFWNAQTRGNGLGTSFIALNGEVFYVAHCMSRESFY